MQNCNNKVPFTPNAIGEIVRSNCRRPALTNDIERAGRGQRIARDTVSSPSRVPTTRMRDRR